MGKILIVDDDLQTTTLLESLIKMTGHEATSVNLSRHAIQIASSINPDLILLDIMMEGINGIELCKLIKSDSILGKTPVIMVSALDDIGSKRDSFNAGAVDFITKPVRPGDFTKRITEVLGS
ncbi:MAG: response regulator [Anaerolineales bacterium]|nr:response regulator [Anaerolineales bacterium]